MAKGNVRKKALFRHAKRRAKVRYDLQLSVDNHNEIVRLIQLQKGKCLGSQSNRVSHWEIEYKGKILHVVYDKLRKQVVTFLPRQNQLERS